MPGTVSVQAFFRWLLLEKTDQARAIWERWEASDEKKPRLEPDEQQLKLWAMEKDKY